MKIGLIGHVDHGKSCITSAAIEVMKNKGIEVVIVDEKECFDRGITISNIAKDDNYNPSLALSIRNTMPFNPPPTRAERRKLKRDARKR